MILMDAKRDFKSRMKNKNECKLDDELKKLPKDQQKDFQKLSEDMKKYKDKDQAELMKELRERVAKGKKEGTLNDEMMDRFRAQVAPMLDKDQLKNMESIIGALKGDKR